MSDAASRLDQFDLDHYLEILRRRKWIVLLLFIGLFASTWFGSILTTPVYEATTTLQIEPRDSKVGAELLRPVETFGWLDPSTIGSEVEILKSRSIAEQVVRNLNLDKIVDEIPFGSSVSITPIATDSSARLGTYNVVFAGESGRYTVLNDAFEVLGSGEVGAPFNAGGLAFTISDATVQQGVEMTFSILDFNSVVRNVRSRTAVKRIQGTNLIAITVRSDAPQTATAIANEIAQVYSAEALRRKASTAAVAQVFLARQLRSLEAELRRSEQALQEYKTASGVIAVADELQASLRRLTEVELERAPIEARRRQSQALLELLRDAARISHEGLLIATSGIDNPLITDLSGKLADLEIERSSLETRFTPMHPAVIAVRTQIVDVKTQLVAEVEATHNALQEREQALAEIIEGYERDLRSLPEVERNLVVLLRESAVNEGIYIFLLQKYQEAQIVEASEIGNVRIIDPAIRPRVPIRPRTKLNVTLGALLGLLTGIGMALLLEHLDTSIRTPDDVDKWLHVPVFGVIPEFRGDTRKRAIDSPSEGDERAGRDLITTRAGFMALEAYRSLGTNLQFASPDRDAKAFLITSATMEEGKTTTVTNLAMVLAHAESRILLVEGDLRKPAVHTAFGAPQKPGLSEILAGGLDWRGAMHPSGLEGLTLIPSGEIPPNPVEILASTRLNALLEAARAEFDVILFDSPPTLGFADAAVLASKLDATFLVVKAGQTTHPMAERAKTILENVNARVVGVILNRARDHGNGYYIDYDYYKAYRPS